MTGFIYLKALGAVMSPATPTLVPMATPPAAPTMMSAVPAMSASPGAVSLQVSDTSGCVYNGIQERLS